VVNDDEHRLERFVQAQNEGATYEHALSELRAGHKTSHWMWFVFPQVAGLGQNSMSVHYAISSMAEARAYLAHPVLGPRLRECAGALIELPAGVSAREVLGDIDATKLRSSMALFSRAAPEEALFGEVLERYFDGEPDEATEKRL
jgi:uncharacterized protein (DUF1810 family)